MLFISPRRARNVNKQIKMPTILLRKVAKKRVVGRCFAFFLDHYEIVWLVSGGLVTMSYDGSEYAKIRELVRYYYFVRGVERRDERLY